MNDAQQNEPVIDVTRGPFTVVQRKTMYVMKTPIMDAIN